jgi:hypothetical protein
MILQVIVFISAGESPPSQKDQHLWENTKTVKPTTKHEIPAFEFILIECK